MSNIDVESERTDDGWTCEVRVSDTDVSEHTVIVPQSDYESLTDGTNADVDELIRKSFEFLLEREPQNAIMSQFDIMTIESYFPDYPDTIKKYFS